MMHCPLCDNDPTVVKVFGQYVSGCEECEISTLLCYTESEAVSAWDRMITEMLQELNEIMQGEET